MAKLEFLVALVLTLATFGQGYIQELVLHENTALDGNSFLFRKHVDDIRSVEHTDFQAYCTRGFWIAYTDIHFEGEATIIHGMNNSLTCFNGSFPYESFRHGGPLDTSWGGISVYPEENYKGQEALVTEMASGLLTGKSLLYSKVTEWTLYELPDFQGKSVCTSLNVDYNHDLEIQGHFNVTQTLGLSQISSVIRGCDAK